MEFYQNIDQGIEFIEHIQTFLESHDWEPQSGEEWVDHILENGHCSQSIEYLPDSTRLSFRFESDSHEALLSIEFENLKGLDAVLDVIVRHQYHLSERDWRRFVTDLLPVAARLTYHEGEDGDEATVMVTPQTAGDALLEK